MGQYRHRILEFLQIFFFFHVPALIHKHLLDRFDPQNKQGFGDHSGHCYAASDVKQETLPTTRATCQELHQGSFKHTSSLSMLERKVIMTLCFRGYFWHRALIACTTTTCRTTQMRVSHTFILLWRHRLLTISNFHLDRLHSCTRRMTSGCGLTAGMH